MAKSVLPESFPMLKDIPQERMNTRIKIKKAKRAQSLSLIINSFCKSFTMITLA